MMGDKLHIVCLAMIIGGAVASPGGNEDPKNSVKAVCNADNTVDIFIAYDKNATILGLSYGVCTELSKTVTGHKGWSDSGWNVSLDVEACEMDANVRTIQYYQNATFTVGVNDTGMELVFAVFTVASFCEYTKSYTVKYSYGDLTAEEESFGTSGGTLEVAFKIESMNSSFSGKQAMSTKAGDKVFLALEVNSTAFPKYDHADNFTAGEGKLFAPKSCSIFAGDSSVNKTYTLFGPDKCDNSVISLDVSYDDTTNSWHISHVLFLFVDASFSSYDLICTVIVCDASAKDDCVKVHDCLTGGAAEEPTCEDKDIGLWFVNGRNWSGKSPLCNMMKTQGNWCDLTLENWRKTWSQYEIYSPYDDSKNEKPDDSAKVSGNPYLNTLCCEECTRQNKPPST